MRRASLRIAIALFLTALALPLAAAAAPRRVRHSRHARHAQQTAPHHARQSQGPAAPRKQPSAAEFEGQRLPRQMAPRTAAIEGEVRDENGRAVIGATVRFDSSAVTTTADGVFRVRDLAPGNYSLTIESPGYTTEVRSDVSLAAGDVFIVELTLASSELAATPSSRLPRQPELGPPAPMLAAAMLGSYRVLPRRPDADPNWSEPQPMPLSPAREVFAETPDRWDIPMPEASRYGDGGEYPYVKSHWYDPFDRNKLKGDQPIIGQQTFLNLTATSETSLDGRCLPTPTNVSPAQPGSSAFFGRCDQFGLGQTFLFTADLFHGDASFRPVDWRIRVTPAVNVNYLNVQELGVVNVDPRDGTTRLDAHFGLQEAFVEVKLHDIDSNYDFISVRAGIQHFQSDFLGFIFVDDQPGVRVFGNLHSDRWEYNAAYFNLLEKDTNSDLNTFDSRHQQVIVANLYMQDFGRPGYTTEFSVHYNKDDASLHYDDNGFLVRPADIGAERLHSVRAAYLGWAGSGHFGRWNVSHAFYQALGEDDFNPIAGRRVTIDAQMAALEISWDRDWMRIRASAFYASGDANPRDGRATGFDAIVDQPEFAGGDFSFWNREGIPLTGASVFLTTPDSLLPDLRSNKNEGQANFVNPGIFLANGGADFNLTPKLKGVVNVNFLRFEDAAPLELVLFQTPIRNTIGEDYSVGVVYRPPLTENIVVTGGAAALDPGAGFRDIYTGHTLFSLFGNVRVQF
jgi:Carboxypeptidase regulatory-like domain